MMCKEVDEVKRAIPDQRGCLHDGLHVIARRRSQVPVLMRLPCEEGDAVAVFSKMHAPGSFLRSRGLEEDWFARVTSPGELVSLLCGLYASVCWKTYTLRSWTMDRSWLSSCVGSKKNRLPVMDL